MIRRKEDGGGAGEAGLNGERFGVGGSHGKPGGGELVGGDSDLKRGVGRCDYTAQGAQSL